MTYARCRVNGDGQHLGSRKSLRNLLNLLLVWTLFYTINIYAQNTGQSKTQDNDRAVIRAQIEGLIQAYLDGDTEKIYLTNSEDRTSFLGRSTIPLNRLPGFTFLT